MTLKKYLLSPVVLICALLLSSCSGYRETNEGLVVSLLGFDKNGPFTVTAQTVIPSTSGSAECESITAQGENAKEALAKLSDKAVKPLIFDHCAGIALGSGATEASIIEIINLAGEKIEINPSVILFCTDNASDLIKASGEYRQGGYDIIDLIENNSEKFDGKLYVIEKKLSEDKNAKLPYLSVRGGEINVKGAFLLEGSDYSEQKN